MGKEDKPAAAAAPAAPAESVCELYFLKSATLGTHHFAPSDKPVHFDFNNLPAGIAADDINFVVQSGGAESRAMRDARLKAAKAA